MPSDCVEKCSVCDRDDQNELDSLFICGNCAVTVHPACYGVQKSTGHSNWFCRKCESQVRISKIRCDLCPIKEGAFKRSGIARCGWAHVLCALYFPEVRFEEPETMDLIVLDDLPMDRYGRLCIFCERNQRSSQANHGACIQCAWTSCRTYFHVTCARIAGLLSPMPSSSGDPSVSLAVMLSTQRSSPTKSDLEKADQQPTPSTDACTSRGLYGFCSARHKEKFCEVNSRTPSVPNKPSEDDSLKQSAPKVSSIATPLSSTPTHRQDISNLPSPCSSPQHSHGHPPSGIEVDSDPNVNALCTTIVNPSDTSKSLPTATNPCDPSELSAAESVSVKRTCNGLDSWEPAVKSPKVEASQQLKNGPIVTSMDTDIKTVCALNTQQSNVSADVHSTNKDATEVITPSEAGVPQESSITVNRTSKKTSRTRRDRPQSHQKSNSKAATSRSSSLSTPTAPVDGSARNLPLTWPQRPLALRGMCLPVKNTGQLSDSNESASSRANHTPGSPNDVPAATSNQSPLATMQDLLEWQWDQAGALLMQQVEGTDVVSLLDCLHQLKSENDSLEAKLLRLQTRQEHLRSVNARLAASLATMEATTTTLSMDEKQSNRSTLPIKSPGDSPVCTPSTGASSQVNLKSPPIPLLQPSPEQINSTPRSLITTTPTLRPAYPPITTYQLIEAGPSPSPSIPGFPSYRSQPSTPLHKHHSPGPTAPHSKPPSSSQGRTKHVKKVEPRKRSPKQWAVLSSSNENPVLYATAVDSSSLMELSARLSSAIAARQPVISPSITVAKGFNRTNLPAYLPIPRNPICKPEPFLTQPSGPNKPSTIPIDLLSTGIVVSNYAVGQNVLATSSGISPNGTHPPSVGSALTDFPNFVQQSSAEPVPTNRRSDITGSDTFPLHDSEPLPSASTLLDRS